MCCTAMVTSSSRATRSPARSEHSRRLSSPALSACPNGVKPVDPELDDSPLVPVTCCIRSSLPRPVLETARQNHLFLRCGAPVSSALNKSHSQSNPRWTREPSTTSRNRPPSAVVIPGTFSRNTRPGLTSPIIRAMSPQMNRSSAIPFRCPAKLTGWQGNPAVMISTRPRQGLPSKVVTSSQTGASSRVLSAIRAAITAAGNLAHST